MKIGRITISDRAAAGVYEDRSGPEIERVLRAGFGSEAVFVTAIIPDERARIAEALRRLVDEDRCALVVTTGGTGIGPRDVTPEATRAVVNREAPGLAEAMRRQSPLGRLTRGLAGTVGATLVLNTPGSPSGAVEDLEAVLDVLPHALELLAGGRPH